MSSFNQAAVVEQTNCPRSFTISQAAPGALLQFEPPMHSKELAEAIHNYIPGIVPLQEKQRQIVSDFCIWRSQACPDGPASYLYDASPAFDLSTFSNVDLPSIGHLAPRAATEKCIAENKSTSAKPARRSKTNKVAKKTPAKAASSGPRLPGLSIMTKDGVDITDRAPRGPKTKEQREHAALMRRLGSCATCRKRKQRCNPSHHTQNKSSSSSSAGQSVSPSSSVSTPASSAASVNSPVQNQSQEIQISHTGPHLPGTNLAPKMTLTPSDFASFDIGDFVESPAIPSTLDSATLDMAMDTIDPSFFDASVLSTPFDAEFDQFFDDSVFKSNIWSSYQGGSQGVSAFSSHPASGQYNMQNSSVLADISPSSANFMATSSHSGAGRFSDFVPAWRSGSTPYVPTDGSPLLSPEEFGIQNDISRVVSRSEQRVHSTPHESPQTLQHDTQMYGLFGAYAPSEIHSLDILTPTTMSDSSSSQGESSSMSGSLFSAVHQSSYSTRLAASVRNNTVQPHFIASTAASLFQEQVFDSTHTHLQLSVDGSFDQYGSLVSTAQDGHIYRGLAQYQASHRVHTDPQTTSSHDFMESSSSSASLGTFDSTDSQSAPSGDGWQTQFRLAGSPEELGCRISRHASNAHDGGRMTNFPAIQPSFDSQLAKDRQEISEPFLEASPTQSHAATRTPNNNAASREVELEDKRVWNLGQEQRLVDSQSSVRAVIPRDQHMSLSDGIPQSPSRPFRTSRAEELSMAHAGVLGRSSQNFSVASSDDQCFPQTDLCTAGDTSRQGFLQQNNAGVLASQAGSMLNDSRRLLRSQAAVIAPRDNSSTNGDRPALRTEVQLHAAASQPNADSYQAATWKKTTQQISTESTQVVPQSLALLGFVLIAGFILISSFLRANPFTTFLSIIAAIISICISSEMLSKFPTLRRSLPRVAWVRAVHPPSTFAQPYEEPIKDIIECTTTGGDLRGFELRASAWSRGFETRLDKVSLGQLGGQTHSLGVCLSSSSFRTERERERER